MEKKSNKKSTTKKTCSTLEWTEEEIALGVVPNPPQQHKPIEWTKEEIALGVVPNALKTKQKLSEEEKEWLDTFHSLKRKKGIAVTRIILGLINMLVEMPNKEEK